MQPVNSIGDIDALDDIVRGLTAKLSYPMGSLLKIAGRYLHNYCIEITDDNRKLIEESSLTKYLEGWATAAKVTLDAIKKATREAGFPVDNSDLNEYVGKMTVEILLEMAKYDKTRVFRITDLGAGDGETTGAVLDALDNENADELIERCQFTLIEPSEENLWNAVNNLKKHRVSKEHKIDITTIGGTNHNFLRRMRSDECDVVISSAVFHHMILPTYLGTIEQSLAADGVLVVGDWYTTIFRHPAFVADILSQLGMDTRAYHQFQSLFDVCDGDEKVLPMQLGMNSDEIITDYRMLRYILAIGKEFQGIPPENRDEFLEGHCSFAEREQDLKDAGFTTDVKQLKEEHKGFAGMESNMRNIDPYGAARVFGVAKLPSKAGQVQRPTPGNPKGQAKLAV